MSILLKECFSTLRRYLPFIVVLLMFLMASVAAVHAQDSDIEVSLNVGDTVLRVEGKTAPHAFVTVMDNGTTIGTMSSNGNGAFAKSFPSQNPGLHNIRVFANINGGQVTDTVSKNVNLISQAETTVNFFLPTTLRVSADQVSQGVPITFLGHTIPGGKVTIIVDNNQSYNAVADSNGSWRKTISTNGFYVGTHYVYAIVSDQHGNQSAPTVKQPFQVTERREEAPESEDPPPRLQPPIITQPRNNQFFSSSPIEIRGVARANSQIEIWEEDSMIGSVFANHLGNWQFLMRLFKPTHEIQVRVCVTDVCSDFSDPITIHFHGGEPDDLSFRLGEYRYFDVPVNKPVVLKMIFEGGQGPYEAVIDWGDDAVETITLNEAGQRSFEHIYEDYGSYTGIVTLKDSDNNISTQYFSVHVNNKPSGRLPSLPIIALAVAAGAGGGVSLFIVLRRIFSTLLKLLGR